MKTKFAIGCLVQWYEMKILPDYIDTLLAAVDMYDKDEVLIDFKLVVNQELEQIDQPDRMPSLVEEFNQQMKRFSTYNHSVEIDETLTTIADYRREFNIKYCELVDVLVWGETDMLVPKQAFLALNNLHQNVNTPKYLATFGICKMWDETWKVLEHPEFTDKQHSDSKDDWWGLNYDMTKEEMYTFNDKVEELEVTIVHPHKFNGCGLVISSEVVRSGVNIPHSAFFIHEDTAMMLMTQKVLGNIPQYHFRNILMVHNRKHLAKRSYIKGEVGATVGQKRNSNKWYVAANKMCEQNVYNMLNPNYKSYTWKDVFDSLK
jgi:hypothetical protein